MGHLDNIVTSSTPKRKVWQTKTVENFHNTFHTSPKDKKKKHVTYSMLSVNNNFWPFLKKM
jgi:hypothetical protein